MSKHKGPTYLPGGVLMGPIKYIRTEADKEKIVYTFQRKIYRRTANEHL